MIMAIYNVCMVYFLFSDEIAKQLISCKAKLLIGSVDGYPVLQAALNKLKSPIKIISIKANDSQSIPAGTIDFQELIRTTGKTLKRIYRANLKHLI